MEESILTTIKRMLNISDDDNAFDVDIVNHINAVFMVLNQLGVGPEEGFHIEDSTTYWSDYIDDMSKFYAIKTYICLKVRLLFDPPSNSALLNSTNELIKEMEFRLNIEAESATS